MAVVSAVQPYLISLIIASFVDRANFMLFKLAPLVLYPVVSFGCRKILLAGGIDQFGHGHTQVSCFIAHS